MYAHGMMAMAPEAPRFSFPKQKQVLADADRFIKSFKNYGCSLDFCVLGSPSCFYHWLGSLHGSWPHPRSARFCVSAQILGGYIVLALFYRAIWFFEQEHVLADADHFRKSSKKFGFSLDFYVLVRLLAYITG